MDRARELGLEVIGCPLFRIEPAAWEAPDPADYDALLLTSANAIRQGGPGLDGLKGLPVHAVGKATAEAARGAGFEVETVGRTDVAELLAKLPRSLHLLHLAGEDHRPTGAAKLDRRIVYRAAPIVDPGLPTLGGLVVAVHSPRSGARLSELADGRAATSIAAISPATAEACGPGWERVAIAAEPSDKSLLVLAAMLCQTSDQ